MCHACSILSGVKRASFANLSYLIYVSCVYIYTLNGSCTGLP